LLGFGWTAVAARSASWQAAMGDNMHSALMPLLVAARKGLPGGIEFGA